MSDRDNKVPEVGLMSDKDGGVFDRTEFLKRRDENSTEIALYMEIRDLLIEQNKLLRKMLR